MHPWKPHIHLLLPSGIFWFLKQREAYHRKQQLRTLQPHWTKTDARAEDCQKGRDLRGSQRNTINILEENIGRKISDIPCSNIFTDMSPRARDIKERINKWDLIKIKSFCMAKETALK